MENQLAENLKKIKQKLPKEVTLVAVSKTKPEQDILEIYRAGQRIFGENKVQEMVGKYQSLPKDIQWHMIGHLQRNKIKYMAEFVSLIHGVDQFKKLQEINKQAKKHQRVISCLLQVKIAKEETKFGLSFKETEATLQDPNLQNLKNIKIVGLMGMASFTEDKQQVKKEFCSLSNFYKTLKDKYQTNNINFTTLSMGMSGDYPIAIECESNMVRIGSAIFGNRNYSI